MKALKEDPTLSYCRKANPKSDRSAKTYLYSEEIIEEIKERY